jgi:catechol 2,3-dioxygenase-like lactoylglutathione lyase family enzyme
LVRRADRRDILIALLRKVDLVLLRVPSLPAAVRYYVDVIGMTLIKQDGRLASLALGDAELVLHADPDLPAEATYYRVDDVRDLHRRRAELRLTFVSPPSRAARGWRATVKDPFGNVLLILDRTAEPATAPGEGHRGAPVVTEDAKPAGSLFAGVEAPAKVDRRALAGAYERVGLTADDLPYTPQFETLFRDYIAPLPDPKPTRAETWRQLLNLRKGGKLPKLGHARSRPPEVSDDDRARLLDMLGDDIGRRDRLPYTPRFDGIVDAFNTTQGRPLSPHLVWRLVATLAK